jgi:hypothetical protein
MGGAITGASGTGGNGGLVELTGNGGDIVNAASINTSGGTSKGGGGVGGDGGAVIASANDGVLSSPFAAFVAGNIVFSGNITTNGGGSDQHHGGRGGNVSFLLNAVVEQHGQEITLLGYTDIHLNGGNSINVTTGGHGGGFALQNAVTTFFDTAQKGPGGGVANYANVTTGGGSSLNGIGGAGGQIALQAQFIEPFLGTSQVVQNHGSLDASGGSGQTGGGTTDGVVIVAREGVVVTAAISTKGGSATSNGAGGAGGDVNIIGLSGTGASVQAAIDASGGASKGVNGANGGNLLIAGAGVTILSTLTSKGGDTTTAAMTAGQGGRIQLPNNATTGPLSCDVRGGTGTGGASNGPSGTISYDGETYHDIGP